MCFVETERICWWVGGNLQKLAWLAGGSGKTFPWALETSRNHYYARCEETST